MKTRSLYYSLRRQHRIARKNLLENPNGFALCSEITHALRELTNSWDVGTEKPEFYNLWRKTADRKTTYLFVSLSLQRWLKANA